MKDIKGFFNNPEPIFMFSDIEPDKSREYSMIIFDVLHYEIAKKCKANDYAVFKVRLLNGFSEYLDKELVYNFHFPSAAFKIAWQRAKGHIPKDELKKETYDCYIKFKRPSKKQIVFTCREYKRAGLYNSQELK